MPRRNRDYAAEYARRKARAEQDVTQERNRRYGRALLRWQDTHGGRSQANLERARQHIRPEDVYYKSAASKRYWEQQYPRKIRGMEPEERFAYAKKRGILDIFQGSEDLPPDTRDFLAETYLIGVMSRSRSEESIMSRQAAQELYMASTGAGAFRWGDFREWYTRMFNR